jgi:hypothetical protein
MPLAVHIILFVLDMNGLMQFACFWERLAHAHSVCWVAGQDDVQCLMQELFESCKLNGGHQKVCSRNFVQTSSVAMVTRWLLYLVHCDSNRDSLWCIHIYIYIHIHIIYWQYSFMYRLLTIVQCLFSKHSHVAFRLERHRFPGGVRDAARERRSSSDLEMGEKVAIGRGYTMRQPKIKVRLGIMSSSCEFTDEFSLVKSRNPCFYG